ncbi:uncharacterized protein LOC115924137 [Strongylocentrotus purpuratus]|uniref:Peptidase aspartic putative domain-containing protein n=1 Tax=Strongylocentrotus purpuratus TaxID=7668 RepID=A0A7M7NUF4_STRPU|nr:uncharacterized protein LOC115924137 [Strongylocentrotus purpuratus]
MTSSHSQERKVEKNAPTADVSMSTGVSREADNVSMPTDVSSEADNKRSMTNYSSESNTLPVVIPVVVRSRESGCQMQTYAFLDNGSNSVFCTEAVRKGLQTRGQLTNIHLQTMTQDKVIRCQVLKDLEVMDLKGNNIIDLQEVFVQDTIPVSKEEIPTTAHLKEYPYLRHLNLPDISCDVGLLIENNVPRAAEPLEVVNSENGGPYAYRTLLGWAVSGVIKPGITRKISSHRVSVKKDIDQQLITMFNHDFSERVADDKPEKSREDQRFLREMKRSTEHIDGHYQVGLPFKDRNVVMPNNRPQAEQRAAHLQRKFARQPQFHREYAGFMDKVLNKQYAERVPEDKFLREDGKMWFIPHHGVYHPQKQKIRVVYDCAASFKGKSLNDNLLQGPDLTNSLSRKLQSYQRAYKKPVRKEDSTSQNG